jgi:error-prone DNA polymerase
MTLEDETGIVNAVVWPTVFERQRRLVLSASMIAINGKIQREGDVVHLVAQRLFDLSDDLGSLGENEATQFPLPHGRGDEFAHGGGAHLILASGRRRQLPRATFTFLICTLIGSG